jgi:hypothetical protein
MERLSTETKFQPQGTTSFNLEMVNYTLLFHESHFCNVCEINWFFYYDISVIKFGCSTREFVLIPETWNHPPFVPSLVLNFLGHSWIECELQSYHRYLAQTRLPAFDDLSWCPFWLSRLPDTEFTYSSYSTSYKPHATSNASRACWSWHVWGANLGKMPNGLVALLLRRKMVVLAD